ncbi:MAG: polyketide cyclase [Acidobacteria bacterium]|nr:polyketide cyclase [Acidobacteriota bacterium]
MNSDYAFLSRWRIEGTCGEVADVLGDPIALARWWPSVYLNVRELCPPDAHGLGRRVALVTKGWLPYTIKWEFEVVDSRYPHGFTIVATGDFDGRGVWTIEQDGAFVDVTYDWRLKAEKPLLKNLSFLLRPIFEANHRWAMKQGERSLRLELLRRRASSAAARAQVPPPPGPVTYSAVAIVAGAVAIGAGLAYLMIHAQRRRITKRELF